MCNVRDGAKVHGTTFVDFNICHRMASFGGKKNWIINISERVSAGAKFMGQLL